MRDGYKLQSIMQSMLYTSPTNSLLTYVCCWSTNYIILSTYLLTNQLTDWLTYGTDHTQRHIHSHSRICSRLNNYRKKGRGTCFTREYHWSELRDGCSWEKQVPHFFLVIIKPRANPRVQVNATLRVICTVPTYLPSVKKNNCFSLQLAALNKGMGTDLILLLTLLYKLKWKVFSDDNTLLFAMIPITL